MGWTAADIPSQKGRTAIVTGTGGLGYETALELARAGAKVIVAGRNPSKGAAAVDQIKKAVPEANVSFEAVDLASLASIAEFAGRFLSRGEAIDLLINNAGIMLPPTRKTTVDGFESQLGVNYLGHFALTARLLPLLRKAAAPRVVNVTSYAQHQGKINFDDLQAERRYHAGQGYFQSKLAQAIFAVELQRRSDAAGWGLMSNAAHPGYANTELFNNEMGRNNIFTILSHAIIIPLIGHSAAAGALPTLYGATAPQAKGATLYGPTGLMEMKGPPGVCKFAPLAHDADVARRLWDISEKLTGVRFDADTAQAAHA